MKDPHDISFFAETTFRGEHRRFGIRQADRMAHMYIVGKTGTGKSTLIETLIRQDIEAGRGCALIDPHGDLAARVAGFAKQRRTGDLLYFDAADPTQPYGLNPLVRVPTAYRALAASGLIEVFKKMWSDAWGVRMEHILRNTLHSLLETQDATFPDILRLLTDSRFRSGVVRNLENEQVREYWAKEFKNYSFRYRAEAIGPIQNKVGAFLADPLLRRIVTDAPERLRLRKAMDEGKVLVANLAKGRLGEDSSGLLGGLLVTLIGLAAFSRTDQRSSERRPFFVYVDEFQTFTTLALTNMLSELRKYGVGMTIAHQYLHQLDPEIRHAVLGNAGTMTGFRVGAEDASYFAREFGPDIDVEDLLDLPNRHIYLRMMIDGEPSRPFSARTVSLEHPDL